MSDTTQTAADIIMDGASATTSRAFNVAQRNALFALSGGSCAICGTEITQDNFHADHKIPHVEGGPTDIRNGQALCAPCNLSKGASTSISSGVVNMGEVSSDAEVEVLCNIATRKWQKECLQALKTTLDNAGKDFYIDSVTASGKTRMGLAAINELLRRRKGGKPCMVVIVAPQVSVVDGWIDDIIEHVGVKAFHADHYAEAVDEVFNVGKPAAIVLSYSMLAGRDNSGTVLKNSTVKSVLSFADRNDVYVVFDECHHLSLSNTWGAGAIALGNKAKFRLGLSGTLFRTDENEAIPYLPYKNNAAQTHISVPHFIYDYKSALADGVVAPINFRFLGGTIVKDERGQTTVLPFKSRKRKSKNDPSGISDEVYRALLDYATDPDNELLQQQLLQADAMLTTLRAQDALIDDGVLSTGLVIARDIQSANKIRQWLRTRGDADNNGTTVKIVHSKLDKAQEIIKEFRKSNGHGVRWLVSVDMVSEGVDIPSLRAMVYAPSVTTQLYARQAWGRLLRTIQGTKQRSRDEQEVFVFLSPMQDFVEYADELVQQRLHAYAMLSKPNTGSGNGSLGGTGSGGSQGHPLQFTLLDADVLEEGMKMMTTAGLMHFTEEQLSDIVVVYCNTDAKRAEMEALTLPYWVSVMVKMLIDIWEADGADPVEKIARVSERAEEKRAEIAAKAKAAEAA
jgi:superfamily II DNA or RNA helicase